MNVLYTVATIAISAFSILAFIVPVSLAVA